MSQTRRMNITQSTGVSLIIVGAVLSGGITAASIVQGLRSNVDSQSARIEAVEKKQSTIDDIKSDIGLIKYKLSEIEKRLP